MKTQNKSDVITGISLLIISALFSVSLMTQPFDFGEMGPGKNNIFYSLGKALYGVYGFSAVLIPAFFIIAGLSCFSSKWTARKTMRLLTALVPFFTCVITENICRSILEYSGASFSVVKLSATVVIGAMLMIIEFFGIGIFADKIQEKYSGAKKYLKIPRIRIDEGQKNTIFEKHSENQKNEILSGKEKTKNPAFNDVFENANAATQKNDDDDYDKNAALKIAENDNEKDENPNSMITQEEFAALVLPSAEESDAEENKNDELEWNLPPQPENLPPEYDGDFDEDDPDLEFPPKDEDFENESKTEAKNSEENAPKATNFEQFDEKTFKRENPDEFSKESAKKNPDFTDEKQSAASQNDTENLNEYNYFDIKIDAKQTAPNVQTVQKQFAENHKNENSKNAFNAEKSAQNPYADANYMRDVIQKSQFPYGITIRDDSEKKEEKESANDAEVPRSKFPTKINLEQKRGDNFFLNANDDFDDFSQDENAKPSIFNVETPALFKRGQEQRENLYDKKNYGETETVKKNAASRDFGRGINLNGGDNFSSDNYDNSDDFAELEELPDENSENRAEQEYQTGILSQAAQEAFIKKNPPQNDANANDDAQNQNRQNAEKVSGPASNVFKEMEDEIRKDYFLKRENNNADAEIFEIAKAAKISDIVEIGDSDENGAESENNRARNFTDDELSDFFNAQQEENTPKGNEIQANPTKIGNRAAKKGPYVIPSDLLIAYKDDEYWVIDDATKKASLTLKQTLAEFNIEAHIIGIKKGPVVTMFEILPAPGVKLRKIVELQDNIALNLAAQSVRIVAPIPGKQAVGIEVPNRHRSVVGFREIVEMNLAEWQKMSVPVILGKDILGKAQLIDLVKTPHMLIAGATGSGKSVCVNSIILSILYKRSFSEVKLILVDPKVVELKLYNNIPYLLTPVITEPKKALQALKWALCEMERRYALLDQFGVRDVSTYNSRIKEQQFVAEKLPYIVIIIDEFADLMATSGKELETVIARLTAMSRAVGIHLVLATQRPSVNVITGLIKANIPTRIAFMVASRTDSNIIIDTNGAEKLLGRGDMLYASAVDPAPIRIQGTFVTDQEVEDVARAVKEYGEPDYIDDEIFFDDEEEDGPKDLFGDPIEGDDPLYDQALEIVVQAGKASASYIQRKLKIGYNRAARLVEEMEERGIVGPANGSKPREIVHIP